jgi:hypothetical protein
MWGEIDTSNDARVREIRRCAKCSAPAVTVFHVTQHYSRGLPTGRSYDHRCGACNVTFESISHYRAFMQLLFAGITASVGFSMMMVLAMDLMQYGITDIASIGARGWGYTLGGFAIFLAALAWGAWTTWIVCRLLFLHPVAGQR